MKEYGEGTLLFCDFTFCGKPRAKCIEVVEEGSGAIVCEGKIKVRLLEACKGYKEGEIIDLDACTAVPVKQELRLRKGQFTRRVNTAYRWVKNKQPNKSKHVRTNKPA